MATQAAVSGNARKNNGATVVKAGNIASTDTHVTNNKTLRSLALRQRYENRPFLAVSGTSSGNVGTAKPYSDGTFAFNPAYNASSSSPVVVIARRVSTTISGAANTVLKDGASDKGIRKHVHGWIGDRLYDETNAAGATFDIFAGTLTKGSNAGNLVEASGLDNTIGRDADHTVSKATFATPGELVFIEGSVTPSQKDYAAKYSP